MSKRVDMYMGRTLFDNTPFSVAKGAFRLSPFVKWAGGKRQLLPELLKRVPEKFNVYFEPFLGGGALLLALQPSKAIVGDINEELINAYQVIRDNVEELISALKRLSAKHSREFYYYIRSLEKSNLDRVERAARFIYLNKTCYNGLYGENSKGQFNVPIGRYANPSIYDANNLRALSKYFNSADVNIIRADYRDIVKHATRGDFIYFDPPYIPVSETANFTKYTKYDFTVQDHEELASVFKELSKRGCYVMLSNSDTEVVYKLYEGFRIEKVKANRFINSNSQKRTNHYEVIIRNY